MKEEGAEREGAEREGAEGGRKRASVSLSLSLPLSPSLPQL